jgi:hypothetical protein
VHHDALALDQACRTPQLQCQPASRQPSAQCGLHTETTC